MNILKKIKSIISYVNPRYTFALDDHTYDIKTKKIIFRFKCFGDHSFKKATFEEIKSNRDYLFNINPNDLLSIAYIEYQQAHKTNMLTVSELLRENKYKITDGSFDQVFSGDDVCGNISLMEKLNNIDLYKIAYSTGFNHGRELTKACSKKIESEVVKSNCNVIRLDIINSGTLCDS